MPPSARSKELRLEDRRLEPGRQFSRRSKNCGTRRPRSRSSSASRATNAPSCSATSTRSSSRRKAPGPPSAWKMRCCASASTTSRPKWQNSPSSSRGRIRRSRPCWPRNRRRRKPGETRQRHGRRHQRRAGGRRHARRAHPGAAVPRLPRPPARGVVFVLTGFLPQISLCNLRKPDCHANRCPPPDHVRRHASLENAIITCPAARLFA